MKNAVFYDMLCGSCKNCHFRCTQHNIPDDILHSHRRENLKFYMYCWWIASHYWFLSSRLSDYTLATANKNTVQVGGTAYPSPFALGTETGFPKLWKYGLYNYNAIIHKQDSREIFAYNCYNAQVNTCVLGIHGNVRYLPHCWTECSGRAWSYNMYRYVSTYFWQWHPVFSK
jgi:hypothetical protein